MGCAGLCASGRGADDGGRVGGACGVLAGRIGGWDGGGLVGSAGGCARHGDGVDAVDGGGDVDGGVVDLAVGRLGEGECDERKEEDNDLLEGAHVDCGDGGGDDVVTVSRSACCCE